MADKKEKKTAFTHKDMANAFSMGDLTPAQEKMFQELLAKKEAAEQKRKDFYAEVVKHKDEVLRALGLDENGQTPLSEEDDLKIRIADAAIEWGAQKGYSPEQLLVKFPEWVEQNNRRNQNIPGNQ